MGRFFRANVRIAAGAKQCVDPEIDGCNRLRATEASQDGGINPA
jgi:hypothetical protein